MAHASAPCHEPGWFFTIRADVMIERTIDFERMRGMRCGSCGHVWSVDGDWLGRFDQGDESCPECGTDCRVEERPDFWVRPDDASQDDSEVQAMYWYHTSTHEDWPRKTVEPGLFLTDETKQRMNFGDGCGAGRWAERQKRKALHLGTYEAAIENMFRRMADQGSEDDQFYLYRVQLSSDAVLEPGVHREPTNFVGDVELSDICAPGVDVYRYVNTHEDPSSVSLVVSVSAIHAVQRISIPLPIGAAHPWVTDAEARLLDALSAPPPSLQTVLERMRGHAPSAFSLEVRKLEKEAADLLPRALRSRLDGHIGHSGSTSDRKAFASKLIGLAELARGPAAILRLLDSQPWRMV
jgi:hypothetical protein